MWKVLLLGSVSAMVCLSTSTMAAQSADEVAKLKKEYELLQRENALLRKEIKLLKKEANSRTYQNPSRSSESPIDLRKKDAGNQSGPNEAPQQDSAIAQSSAALLARIQGSWDVQSAFPYYAGATVTITGDRYSIKLPQPGRSSSDYRLGEIDATKDPAHVTMFHLPGTSLQYQCLIKVSEDGIILVRPGSSTGVRPQSVDPPQGARVIVFRLVRAKTDAKSGAKE